MMGSVYEHRIPSSTRIWRAERAKIDNNSPCSESQYPPQLGGAAAGRGHCLYIGRIGVLQLWHSLLRPADGSALSGAARGMLKLLLPTGQSKS